MDSPTADLPLPGDILEDIFLRLDDAADLARASAACTSFRRLVSARRFLRRFRSLHRPPILGCLSAGSENPLYQPVDPPHRSAAAAAALARAADFDFSFINPRKNWEVHDVRDSRVLLSPRPSGEVGDNPEQPFEYFVVCDPLHRRYATIPGIPADLRPSSRLSAGGLLLMEFEVFLDTASEKENGEEDLPFRVICNVIYHSMFVTLFFSSVTGEWQHATSFTYGYKHPFVRHYAHNCFYWTHFLKPDMLVLDRREMKFSVVNLPPPSMDQRLYLDINERAIVDAGEGRLGLFALGSNGFCLEFYLNPMRNNGIGTEDWKHEKTISLPNLKWSMYGASEDCLILRAVEPGWYKLPAECLREPGQQFFAVELKKLQVERLCVFDPICDPVFPYASFPPSFSLPSI